MKRLLLLAGVISLLLAGCTAQSPTHATVGIYRGGNGVEVQLNRAGKGTFVNVPAKAVVGRGESITGPIRWATTKRSGGGLDLQFYGGVGIRPEKYQNSAMSAIYQVEKLPEIQFVIGDPDEGRKLVLTLVES